MTIDFISDLHLDKTRPEVNKYFINYLDNINKDVTDLYILGDLFEYWVGDDDPMDGLNAIRASISQLGAKINIWYMHGNRDFLISKKICSSLNMHFLEDPTVITKNGQRLLLLQETLFVQMITNIKNLDPWLDLMNGRSKCYLNL